MGTTAHHRFPVPNPSDEVRKVRLHLTALAEDIDAKVPKITYGQAGSAYPSAPREGDIHLTYVNPTPVPSPAPPAQADEPVAPAEAVTVTAPPKRSRKATG